MALAMFGDDAAIASWMGARESDGPPEREVWYRYVDVRYSTGLDECDRSTGSRIEIQLDTYAVIKHTKCGVWIALGGGGFRRIGDAERRFVSSSSRKRFAHATKAEALESFIYRKRKQASIYEARARGARQALAAAERMRDDAK